MMKEKTQAWVIFSGQADLPWLKILKEGYRHCYILLNDGKRWITIDPLSSYMDITVHDEMPLDFNLPLWLKNQGNIIMPAAIRHVEKQAPWMPFSCVEAVKRILGIHKSFIFTPWQLYQFLRKEQTARTFQKLPQRPPQKHKSLKGDFAWEA